MSRLALLSVVAAACGSRSASIERAPWATEVVTIHVVAAGLTAEQVEQLAVVPIERAIAGAGRLRTIATVGHATIMVGVERGADRFHVRSTISAQLAQASVPDDVHVQLAARSADHRATYVLRSDQRTPAEVRTFQEWVLRPQLLSVAGVVDVVSCGGATPAIEIAVQPQRLRALDVSIENVLSTLSRSVSSVGGHISGGSGGDYLVRGAGGDLHDLQALTIAVGPDSVPVRLGDLAELRRRDRPAPCQAVLGDGTAVVIGDVMHDSPGDVRARMQEIRAALPPGVEVEGIDPAMHVRIGTQPSADPDERQRLAQAAARDVAALPGVERALALVGGEADDTDRLPGEIDVLVVLAPRAPATRARILEVLRRMPGVTVRRPDLPRSSRVRLEVTGADREALAETAAALQRLAQAVHGVENAVVIGAGSMPRRSITLDRRRMSTFGISPRDVTDAVQLASDGLEAGVSIEGAQRIPIVVRWADADRDSKDVGAIPIRAPDGSWLTLQQVADIELADGPVALMRSDGLPSIVVWIELDPAARRAEAELRRRIAEVQLGPQTSVVFY